MNREIKFRGKSIATGEWVYGNLIGTDVIVGGIVDWDDEYFCTEFWYKVYPETVGQYTGLKDIEVGYNDRMELCCGSLLLHRERHYATVIGNKFGNPSLLEAK
ncbi:hypothetical protein NYE48_27860 [Paenibacillus sp. FSL M7-1455]|uniref:hypothetical protein n=1 Tax=Paenibacillus sp. FSL M7-1455 TaxID=2975316 RepID=UPI0030F57359